MISEELQKKIDRAIRLLKSIENATDASAIRSLPSAASMGARKTMLRLFTPFLTGLYRTLPTTSRIEVSDALRFIMTKKEHSIQREDLVVCVAH